MTIDEAIQHCEEKAEDKKRVSELCKNTRTFGCSYEDEWSAWKNVSERYFQIADWLKELKSLKEKADDIDEVGMVNIKLALNDGAVKHIKKICNKSDCGKCPYTLKKMSCIFSVCPMDWEVNDDEND